MLQIRLERKQRGWTLADVTRRTGIAGPDVSRVERGVLPAYPGWRKRLSRAFRKPEDVLFARAGEKEAT